jgi:TfoX-like protein
MGPSDLERLPGIGPTTASRLVEVGVESSDDIDRLGSVEVFRRLEGTRQGVSLNALWVLEALLLGCDWRDLPADRKAQLRAAVRRDPDRPRPAAARCWTPQNGVSAW